MKEVVFIIIISLFIGSCNTKNAKRVINCDLAPDSVYFVGIIVDGYKEQLSPELFWRMQFKVLKHNESLIYSNSYCYTQICFLKEQDNDSILNNCQWCIPDNTLYPTRVDILKQSPFIVDYVKYKDSKVYLIDSDSVEIFKFVEYNIRNENSNNHLDTLKHYSYYMDHFGLIAYRRSNSYFNNFNCVHYWVANTNSLYYSNKTIKNVLYRLIRDTSFYKIDLEGLYNVFSDCFLDSIYSKSERRFYCK